MILEKWGFQSKFNLPSQLISSAVNGSPMRDIKKWGNELMHEISLSRNKGLIAMHQILLHSQKFTAKNSCM